MTPPKTPCQACANAEADSKTHTDVFHHAEIRKLEALDIAHHLEVAQLKFDLESAQSISERKDARIRELEGDVEERDRQMAWALKSSKTKDVLRRQMAENKRAALARSEGGT